ncbi:alkyl/aryl-sulfatase [Ilumatobacter sp.]|uniref:alkyl/aryl-sulfatase n=1 Tax=Ilumatobacter sp. TaxID=1967498 RepID=UPI003B52C802
MSDDHAEAPSDGPRPATEATRRRNSAAVVDFDDDVDLAGAERGLVAQHPTGRIERDGRPVWDIAHHDFLRYSPDAPDTVHPGLWRQGRLNAIHGLFEVADGVWQARGYDLSNITFIAADSGWLIIDPLTAQECAAACLALANEHLGERPVSAVIYTHSHLDHFGGMLGVTTREAVERGDVRVIAPEGFMHEAVGENVLAGPIMGRRSMYQFGPLLPFGPRGQVDAGLGKTVPLGTSALVAPTETIHETGTELDVDGVRIAFQSTPDAEAPSEMNFFFPDKRLLCMAENCTHTLHNLYPIRGAQVRDALAWSKYIHEALRMWGPSTDTMFASHHWPRFGTDDVDAFLRLQRDVYRWMHDQTLRLANHGRTPDEISEELSSLPDCFASQSHVQGYYGTVSHNVRSVYDRYLGWYDGNPANLHPHPPVEAGRRYVEMMGGPDAVVRGAREAFDGADYRWTVEVLGHLIFTDPEHREARALSADAMEQLGYQSESSTWRNAYLMGAHELRNGTIQLGRGGPPALASGMTGEQMIDMMGTRFDPAELDRDTVSVAWTITDVDPVEVTAPGAPGAADGAPAVDGSRTHRITVENDTVHHDPGATEADAVVELTRDALVEVIAYPERLDERIDDGTITLASGDRAAVADLLGSFDTHVSAALVEP